MLERGYNENVVIVYLYKYMGHKTITETEYYLHFTDYNKNKLRAKDMIAHYDYMIENIEKYNIQKETKEFVKRYYTNSVILKTQTLNEQEQKEYIKEIKKRKMYKNIKVNNIKQLIKRILLAIDVKLYLKMR